MLSPILQKIEDFVLATRATRRQQRAAAGQQQQQQEGEEGAAPVLLLSCFPSPAEEAAADLTEMIAALFPAPAPLPLSDASASSSDRHSDSDSQKQVRARRLALLAVSDLQSVSAGKKSTARTLLDTYLQEQLARDTQGDTKSQSCCCCYYYHRRQHSDIFSAPLSLAEPTAAITVTVRVTNSVSPRDY